MVLGLLLVFSIGPTHFPQAQPNRIMTTPQSTAPATTPALALRLYAIAMVSCTSAVKTQDSAVPQGATAHAVMGATLSVNTTEERVRIMEGGQNGY